MRAGLLHQRLRASARQWPERPAVVAQGGSLSYRALDEQSDRLAAALQAGGVTRGERVGLHLDKSIEAVVALYGVLKAGAAYVPLDPRAPMKRTAFVAANARLRGLICGANLLEPLLGALRERPACLIGVDSAAGGALPWSEALATGRAPADAGNGADDLAYILYTSGSTGEPKGVMLGHRAALAFVDWAVAQFALRPEDRLASHAPLHFDLSVFDLFAAAAAGASVALVPPGTALFARNLAEWIEKTAITVWYSVPSALVQLALNGALERFPYAALRCVLFAGEPFPVEHLRALMTQLPAPAYFNLYGPTESNVCTFYRVPGPPPPDSPPLPIGRACPYAEALVADDELLVGGPSLMEGYWDDPERTARALIAHPQDASRRLYRTGDLVRRDAQGELHFHGRRDAQVKSRGYRIELGEVEAALYRHAAVAEAAVVTRPHPEFGCVLRAVVVPRLGAASAQPDMRRELAAFCAESLPPYMIPEDFVFLDALPKTSSGKLDRSTLQKEQANAAAGNHQAPGRVHRQ